MDCQNPPPSIRGLKPSQAECNAVDNECTKNGCGDECRTDKQQMGANREDCILGSLAACECKHRNEQDRGKEIGLADWEIQVAEGEAIKKKNGTSGQCRLQRQPQVRREQAQNAI